MVELYRDPEGKKIPLTSSNKSEQHSDQINQLGRKKSDCTNVNKADHAAIEIVVQDTKEVNKVLEKSYVVMHSCQIELS